MAERRTIGRILMDVGRLTERDTAQALDYQREHGGYFGEALLALGLVSQDALEWGLASQADLPYIFPDAASVDPGAAHLVSPEWALAHLTLPILRAGEVLTVVVESPTETDAVGELRASTGLTVELALASATKIRELIRQVFARGTAAEQGDRPVPIHLTDAFGEALQRAAARFGVSTRGHRSWAWWDDAGTIRRRPLEGLWEAELDALLEPPLQEQVAGRPRATWGARLNREGTVTSVEVRYLADEAGHELLFRPVHERTVHQERFPPPVPAILSEILLLARSGSARLVVTATPDELGHDILPHLPTLLFDPSWRSIFIHAAERRAADAPFGLRLPTDPHLWAAELEALRAFHFDVVTVDLPAHREDWVGTALDVASVAFLLWPMEADRRPAYDAGMRWELHIAGGWEDRLEWTLEPLHGRRAASHKAVR
ncbi:MAG TPA: hypothetical protein VJ997_13060 [Longimicrobiales bacterium]|nr:hypothetical protein [Longimicrobiales bacterium]